VARAARLLPARKPQHRHSGNRGSRQGWIRAVRGHKVPAAEQKYKDGDSHRFAVNAETTDRLIVLGTNGRFYTIGVDRLPGGRGRGEPLRLMIDLPNEHDIAAICRQAGADPG
jgi:topoisomerase-4 subunit A